MTHEESGLAFSGLNAEGEREWIGTKQQWDKVTCESDCVCGINLSLPADEEAKALATLQREEDAEASCAECNGEGIVTKDHFDENSKEWVTDGTKKCFCKLEEIEPLEEVTN